MELLSISNFSSHACAFEASGCRVSRARPAELLRGGFDSILEFIKTDEYDMVWIDLSHPSRFVSANQMSNVMQRVRALVTACQRYDVPCVLSSAHAGAWHISCVQAMVTACDLKMSTHRWCTFGITTELFHPSAVTHRCASTFAWQCTPCQCPPSAEHVHDLALRDKTCTSHRRHNCEVKAMANLLRSAWACVSMSGKPADSTNLESQQSQSLTLPTCSQCTTK